MPAQDDHFRQARRNRNFYQALENLEQAYPEWLVAIGFYVLVQYSEGLVAQFGYHPTSHNGREDALTRVSQAQGLTWLDQVFPLLQRVRTLSNDARYGRPGVGFLDWKNDPAFAEFVTSFRQCCTAFEANVGGLP